MKTEKLVRVEMPSKNWRAVLSVLHEALGTANIPAGLENRQASADIITKAMLDAGEIIDETSVESILKRVEEASKGP